MADFIVKAIPIDGMNWPIRSVLLSLDSTELGDAEWWRRMAILQNAAGRAGDGMLLDVLDTKKQNRWGSAFDEPEIATDNNLPQLTVEAEVKRYFQKLEKSEQYEFLKTAMENLLEVRSSDGKKNIFSKKQDWMGIYMVLRDRLGFITVQKEFHKEAEKFTPDTCPKKLKITSTTMSNFSKMCSDGPYYKMKNNPFSDICNTFWTIVKTSYYNVKKTNR
jgi:hypothetical protein